MDLEPEPELEQAPAPRLAFVSAVLPILPKEMKGLGRRGPKRGARARAVANAALPEGVSDRAKRHMARLSHPTSSGRGWAKRPVRPDRKAARQEQARLCYVQQVGGRIIWRKAQVFRLTAALSTPDLSSVIALDVDGAQAEVAGHQAALVTLQCLGLLAVYDLLNKRDSAIVAGTSEVDFEAVSEEPDIIREPDSSTYMNL